MSSEKQECYLCGRTGISLTRDHIPPKGLFPEPRPSDLITVPCCEECNNKYSEMDEFFRLATSACIDGSESGKQIWEKKVVGSTIKSHRLSKRIHHLRRNMRQSVIKTQYGDLPVVEMGVKPRPIRLMLIKITKGLLFKYCSDIDYHLLEFRAEPLHQLKVNAQYLSSMIPMAKYLERGSKVFQCWYGVAHDVPTAGLWLYLFYNAAPFFVMHGPRGTILRK